MIGSVLTSLAAVLMAQQAAAEPEAAAAVPQPAPEQVKVEKITDRSHPDFVRCERYQVVGSRARFKKQCFTNREWDRIAAAGNRSSRAIVQQQQRGIDWEN